MRCKIDQVSESQHPLSSCSAWAPPPHNSGVGRWVRSNDSESECQEVVLTESVQQRCWIGLEEPTSFTLGDPPIAEPSLKFQKREDLAAFVVDDGSPDR